MDNLKLFMLLLGCKPEGRHTEQHDVFFGIASSLKELIPEIQSFWRDSGRIHIDAWREVTHVDGYKIMIKPREEAEQSLTQEHLYFINLGGYQPNRFEEQHYIVLAVSNNSGGAVDKAKNSLFFKHNQFKGANSHIDDKYGIDVDDIYQVEDILTSSQKTKFRILLQQVSGLPEDDIHLGYFKLNAI